MQFVHLKANGLLRLMQIIHWFVFYFDYTYLIRLCEIAKPIKGPLTLQSICKYSNDHNFPIVQPILMKLVSKPMVYRALSYKTCIIKVVSFNYLQVIIRALLSCRYVHLCKG